MHAKNRRFETWKPSFSRSSGVNFHICIANALYMVYWYTHQHLECLLAISHSSEICLDTVVGKKSPNIPHRVVKYGD